MALTRKFLSALGIEQEKIDEIISAHSDTVEALKAERDGFKADAEKLASVQKELDKLKANTADYEDLKSYKTKYNDEHDAFEQYKKEIASAETLRQVKEAYKALLKASGVDEKRFDTILKVTDFTGKKLGEDGKLEGEKDLAEAIKTEWKDFVVSTSSKGTNVDTPPSEKQGEVGNNAQWIRQRAQAKHEANYGVTKKEGE